VEEGGRVTGNEELVRLCVFPRRIGHALSLHAADRWYTLGTSSVRSVCSQPPLWRCQGLHAPSRNSVKGRAEGQCKGGQLTTWRLESVGVRARTASPANSSSGLREHPDADPPTRVQGSRAGRGRSRSGATFQPLLEVYDKKYPLDALACPPLLDTVACSDISVKIHPWSKSQKKNYARPSSIKSQFWKILITFGDKGPRNGSKNDLTAPKTTLG